jgi:hypothetical protein
MHEKMSTSLAIKKMQVKKQAIQISSHLSQNDYHQESKQQMLVRVQGKMNTYMLLGELQINAANMKISMEFLQKSENIATRWSKDTTLGNITEEM